MTTGSARTPKSLRRVVAVILAVVAAGAFALPASAQEAPPTPSPSPRIIGGTTAPAGAWPSQVAILWSAVASPYDAQFCGGTLVARSWVLTAAHCLLRDGYAPDAADLDVLVGTQDLTSGGTRIAAAELRVHPQWDPATFRHDVGLIRLADPAPASIPLQPMTAPDSTPPPGTSVTVTGWGTVTVGAHDRPERLQQVQVSIVSDAGCGAAYGPEFHIASMVCAAAAGRDACQGDSGGPLVHHDGSRWVQVGIVSSGNECADPDFPGIYTRLASFATWVDDQVRYGPHPHASAFVRATYRDLYDREPSAAELYLSVVALDEGLSPASFVRDRITGPTYQARAGGITRLYRASFLRWPEAGGFAYWHGRMNDGLGLSSAARLFAASAELRALYGHLDDPAFVTRVYQNVLGRTPAARERDFWVGELTSGRRSRGRVLVGFSESAEHRARVGAEVAVVISYLGIVDRAASAGDLGFWAPRSVSTLVSALLRSAEYDARF